MKKLLFVLTLGFLFVDCNNGKSTSNNTKKAALRSKNPADHWVYIDTPQNTQPWYSTFISSDSANYYDSTWKAYANGPNNAIPTYAFIINANALFHAVTDSANITNVIFFLGMNPTNKALKLMYLPARGNIGNLTEVFPLATKNAIQVFNQSVPCPTCNSANWRVQPIKPKL